jgi:hypothetical protein
MRDASPSAGLLFALLSAACGGSDLTLPDAGDPASLTIVAGNGQRGNQGEPLSQPLVVKVQDGLGRPVAGTSVAFRFTENVPDATVAPGAAATDGQGQASARAQLGRREGPQVIEAQVAAPGQDLRVQFQLTAMANDPGNGGGGGGNGNGGGGQGGGKGHGGGGGSGPPPAPDPPRGDGGGGGGHGNGHGHGDGHGDGHGGDD